jgi:hypothetical protein
MCIWLILGTAWKQANVIPMLKHIEDLSDPKTFRPISLLNALRKILKRLLLHRLKSHVAEHWIYLNVQFGFCEKHSTSHLRATKHIAFGLAAKLSVGMLLLDVEKTFDCEWHDAMLNKLLGYRFPMVFIKLIWSFLMSKIFTLLLLVSATGCSSLSDTLQFIYYWFS